MSPGPDPDGVRIVIQEAVLLAVQAQPAAVSIVTCPLPPSAPNVELPDCSA